jgi:hypothetical protein
MNFELQEKVRTALSRINLVADAKDIGKVAGLTTWDTVKCLRALETAGQVKSYRGGKALLWELVGESTATSDALTLSYAQAAHLYKILDSIFGRGK